MSPRIDRWLVLALVLPLLPLLLLVPLGLLWLAEQGLVAPWLVLLGLTALAGLGLQLVLRYRERRLLGASTTGPDPGWPASADAAWAEVESMADGLDPAEWPLTDTARLVELGRTTLERVARHYHPGAAEPLLELTAPDALLVVERASRDLRSTLLARIPFSHSLRIGTLVRASRWLPLAEQAREVYRAGRLVINPTGAVLAEALERLRAGSLALMRSDLERWLLQELVRKVGAYAIDLYSGRLPLDDGQTPTPTSAADIAGAESVPATDQEPLRILVLGRTNAGKSSLINALLGETRAVTDVLPGTTNAITPLRLTREGLEDALLLDTPGCDTEGFDEGAVRKAAADADLLLWVTPVHRPDRAGERALLDGLREAIAARAMRRPPPLLVAASHIDRLRPSREWQPPYDLSATAGKGASIAAAVAAVCADLAVAPADTVPVCLADARTYNVDDALWTLIRDRLDQARQARLLRLQAAHRAGRHWPLIRRQLAGAGDLLLRVSSRLRRRRG